MIDITILKVEHGYVKQAKKLLPYIKECDVFGPEAASMLERVAVESEEVWETVIKSDMSRTKFFEFAQQARVDDLRNQVMRDYMNKMEEYLFLEKKLRWSPERYSDYELKEIKQLQDAGSAKGVFNRLFNGDTESYFELAWKYHASSNVYVDARDQHIARQLDAAGENLRKRYPALSNKEPLKYTIFLGSAHQPENFMRSSAKVIQLGTLHASYTRLHDAVRKGDRSDEAKRYTLIWQHISYLKNRTLEELNQKSLPELISIVKQDYIKNKFLQTLKK